MKPNEQLNIVKFSPRICFSWQIQQNYGNTNNCKNNSSISVALFAQK